MAENSASGKESRDLNGRPAPPAGVISLHELYTIEEAKARLRWTDSALRAAKRNGLTLLKCGKRRYVTGAEIYRFLESIQNHPQETGESIDV